MIGALLLAGCADDSERLARVNVPLVGQLEDGRALVVSLRTCRDGEVTVEETEEEVRLTGRGPEMGPMDDCFGDAAEVRLERPLNGRTVVDTRTGNTRTVMRCDGQGAEPAQSVCDSLVDRLN